MKIYHKITGKLLFDGDLMDFSGADLRGANFRGANLRWANCRGLDLRGANFRGSGLRGADFHGANVKGVMWPTPTEVLSANWGVVSDDLTRDLMIFDGWCHPDPTAFDRWADEGPCPYDEVNVQRAANFKERKDLWSLGPKIPKSPLELMDRLLIECCVGHVLSRDWT